MSSRKRNQWLEADNVDDEFFSADEGSEQEEPSKAQIKSRSIKRRRIDDDLSNSEDEGFSDDEGLDKSLSTREKLLEKKPNPSNQSVSAPIIQDARFARFKDEDQDGEDSAEDEGLEYRTPLHSPEKKILPGGDQPEAVITPAQLKAQAKAKKKSGVIYVSRIPPFMKPQTVKTYLSHYGEIGKLFLTPEDGATYKRRVRSGGNKKHSYVDGWVEFLSKNDAKTVAEVLNGNIMGGKKGNYYHDDIWNIKYLKGFKWDDLTEQIARENKEREARLRADITKAKRENEGFVRDIERGKLMERKKQRGDVDASTNGAGKDGQVDKPARHFKQKMAKEKRKEQDLSAQQHEATGRVLDKM